MATYCDCAKCRKPIVQPSYRHLTLREQLAIRKQTGKIVFRVKVKGA